MGLRSRRVSRVLVMVGIAIGAFIATAVAISVALDLWSGWRR